MLNPNPNAILELSCAPEGSVDNPIDIEAYDDVWNDTYIASVD